MEMFLEIFGQSALLILILLVLRPALKKVLGARFRYALWLLPALRFMVPFSVQSAVSIWNIAEPVIPIGWTKAGNNGMAQALAGITVPSISPAVMTTASQTMQAATPGLDAGIAMPLNWLQLLSFAGMAVWILGSLAALFIMVRNNIRIAQRLRRTERISIDGKVPVIMSDIFPSPCLAGLLRPCIVITAEVLSSKMLLDMVLRHELTHYRRRDYLWTALRSILLCLWWWNPLAWLAAHYSREDCEAACDEAVICFMSLESRRQYGMSLIALLRKTPSTRSLMLTTTAMQSSKRAMKERITMIANWKNKGRIATICIVLCVALLIPVLCTSAVGQTAASAGPNATKIPAPADTTSQEKKMEKTLGNITFAVQDMYYDGRVAMLTMQRTASQPDVVMVDEVFRDSTDGNPVYGGEGETGHMIPTYCDISFYHEIAGKRVDILSGGGGGMASGNPLDSYGFTSAMPLDISPDSVKAIVTIATLTPQLDTYEQEDSLIVDIPKTATPLVDAALDLDMGSTVVKHIVVSRTPLLLVVHVYHQPEEGKGYRFFSVHAYGDAVLKHRSSDTEDMEEAGWVQECSTYYLSKDDPLPEALRLHYGGGTSKELIVDLTAGTVEVLE
jgi:beta-lactamase regulating signal transducer with metallopeptidase domain